MVGGETVGLSQPEASHLPVMQPRALSIRALLARAALAFILWPQIPCTQHISVKSKLSLYDSPHGHGKVSSYSKVKRMCSPLSE